MRDELDSGLGGLRTYSAREVGEVLGRSARTVRRLRVDGRLRAVLVGREWRYLLEDVRAYVEGLRMDGGHRAGDDEYWRASFALKEVP